MQYPSVMTAIDTIFNTPHYPLHTPSESCYLFCSNHLLNRKHGYREYQLPQGDQSPFEHLTDAMRSLQLYRLEKGTPLQTGDLILIRHKRHWFDHIIIHSMIVIESDIWYGADNARFFSRTYSRLGTELLKERDAVNMFSLHLDAENYSFGKYCFEVWRQEAFQKKFHAIQKRDDSGLGIMG